MGDNTKIEWSDATWNPVSGCSKVSAGCKHCYAEREWPRLANNPKTPRYKGRAFTDVQCHREMLDLPMRWARPRKVFVNSMSDLFHEDVPFAFIAAVFGIMAAASRHTFQVLTKRPERMLAFFRWVDEHPDRNAFEDAAKEQIPGMDWRPFLLTQLASQTLPLGAHTQGVNILGRWPLPNVWLGVTAENQEAADERIPLLLQTPAAVRFVSVEPMVGAVDLSRFLKRGGACECSPSTPAKNRCGGGWIRCNAGTRRLRWVICGGESGPKARPMHPGWARSLRDQCMAADVPFMFKQLGEWSEAPQGATASTLVHDFADGVRMFRVGKKAAGRLLDGREHLEYPQQQQQGE